MNIEHYKMVLDKIKSCPEQWYQLAWHCGSAHYFAGWAQILSGKPANNATVIKDARLFLQISRGDADWLFDTGRTLEDFEQYLEDVIHNLAGYNRAGYDRYGYDRDGYDRDGYNRYGYDRYGYDRDGLKLVDGVWVEKDKA